MVQSVTLGFTQLAIVGHSEYFLKSINMVYFLSLQKLSKTFLLPVH